MATIVDKRFNELAKNIGYATDNFVFAALAIILCDEIEILKIQMANTQKNEPKQTSLAKEVTKNNHNAEKILEEVINYIETLAIKLEKV